MKVKLEICCGTTCYLLGAGKLMALDKELPEALRELVEFEIRPCLDLCMSDQLGSAPFARMDGEVIAHATPEIIIERIRLKLKGAEND
ncbi:MAG: hypothetical protein PHQ75_14560 [Thermoguttaceae bacterium]|nr:hypothetical protein [Thermoguttaceae bacterium]